MKPAAPGRALLCALGLAFWLSCARGLQRSGSHDWKKLIMVHHWPATVCKSTERGCREPPDYWTIHGLWADKADMCNRSWPFKLDEIKDLMPDMKMYWPDLLHPSPNSSFLWKHEWEKHGTCVAQLEALGSERKYFGKALDLYRGLALNSVLQKLGVLPSGGNYYQCPCLALADHSAVRSQWCNRVPVAAWSVSDLHGLLVPRNTQLRRSVAFGSMNPNVPGCPRHSVSVLDTALDRRLVPRGGQQPGVVHTEEIHAGAPPSRRKPLPHPRGAGRWSLSKREGRLHTRSPSRSGLPTPRPRRDVAEDGGRRA